MEVARRQGVTDDQNNQDLDRISDLPDSLLVHILSSLPFKEAVGTSALSKRWMNLWIDLPILEFEWDMELLWKPMDKRDYARKKISFKNFVNRVLLLNRAPHITSCRFAHLREFDLADTNAWITALSTRQVKEIVFDRCVIDLGFPSKLFTIESLSALDLFCVTIEYTPNVAQFWLPNLKTLRLYRIPYLNSDFFGKLIAGCRVLEELAIVSCDFHNIEIHSLTLNTLSISKFGPSETIVLEAPNLKDFYLCSEDLNIAEAFRGVSQTRNVHLNYHDEPSKLVCENLPWFHNLTCLELKAYSNPKLDFILCMLNHCPNLQNFVLHLESDIHDRNWVLPDYIPQCVSSSLKVFELCAYDLYKSDVHMLKYFLKNAMVLEEMKLNDLKRGSREMCKVLKIRLMPHRASSACRVTFAVSCFH